MKRKKMKKPKISLICGIAEKNRGIGLNNKLLWHIPNDLDHFKKITMGHPIIMGYKTFKSISRPLPGRLNIVLSFDKIDITGCTICSNIKEAIKVASDTKTDEIFFIGGGSIYAQAIDLADKLYLTIVEGDYQADTFFPDYSKFKKIISEQKEESAGYKYRYVQLER